MNRYYTETIPVALAEKLKEKGMMVDIDCDTFDEGTQYQRDEVWCNTTYAEAFDWLMEKDLFIVIEPHWDFADEVITKDFDAAVIRQGTIHTPTPTAEGDTWHEAANAAIEKALELI